MRGGGSLDQLLRTLSGVGTNEIPFGSCRGRLERGEIRSYVEPRNWEMSGKIGKRGRPTMGELVKPEDD